MRVFNLSGDGLVTAEATVVDGNVSLNNRIRLGHCPRDQRPSSWLHASLPSLASEIYEGSEHSFSLASIEKLWSDNVDRSGGNDVGRIFGLSQDHCISVENGKANLIASTNRTAQNGTELRYPIWNINVTSSINIYTQIIPQGVIQILCTSPWDLPCDDRHGNISKAISVLGGHYDNNDNLQSRSSASRRRYEQLCIDFVLKITRDNQIRQRFSCIPRTVLVTGGIIDKNASLFTTTGTHNGVQFIRGPRFAGLIGAALCRDPLYSNVDVAVNTAAAPCPSQRNPPCLKPRCRNATNECQFGENQLWDCIEDGHHWHATNNNCYDPRELTMLRTQYNQTYLPDRSGPIPINFH